MYIDAYHNKTTDKIQVVERKNGGRVFKEFPADNHFYVSDPNGHYKTIFGDKVTKIQPKSLGDKFIKLKKHINDKLWESDINPTMRILEQNYLNCDIPSPNIAFFDIEADFDKDRGYAPPDDPFNEITSIAVYMGWIDRMVCLAVPPKTLTFDEADEIAQEVGDTILFRTEEEMLDAFLTIIEDADILTAWNGDYYDIPYVVGRISQVLGLDGLKRMCLWDLLPKARIIERGGKEEKTFDLFGRIHLDLMELYKKYTYEEKSSYSLDNISEIALEEKKVQYSGNLDQLYNNDFKMFLEYNIQDTLLLYKLESKLQYISLCNLIAHSNCVLLQTTMGTVAMTDQTICIEAHIKGLIVPDKSKNKGETRAAGGWVANAKKGLHHWIGSTDLNSLYPSTIRTLNMSPETIIGQVNLSKTTTALAEWENRKPKSKHTFAAFWNDKFYPEEMRGWFDEEYIDEPITVDMESGSSYDITHRGLKELIFDSGEKWHISANGTIFRYDIEGIVPSILTRWYAERKVLKKIMGNYANLEDNPKNEYAIIVPESLYSKSDEDITNVMANPYIQDETFSVDKIKKLISDGNKKRFIQYMNQHGLTITDDRRLIAKDQDANGKVISFWKKRQHVKKINLNSAYGAILNAGSRFFDQRIGQSTTLTGRNITKHMAAKTNEILTGNYDHEGEVCIYGDTDSVYFSAWPLIKDQVKDETMQWGIDEAIALYDDVADKVNTTFSGFLDTTFGIPKSMSCGVIEAGREVVAATGLFIKKKRYAALIIDDEGKRCDINGKPGKLKVTGLDLRRSDTPKFVQKFLNDILMDTLTNATQDEIIKKIRDFKEEFSALDPWEKGTPKAVNKLTHYKGLHEQALILKAAGKKQGFTIPGHVSASLYWNELKETNNDKHAMSILDGQKIIVCKIKDSPHCNFSSIAYPIDETHIPVWFKELEFDEDSMLQSVVDKKIENLLGVLKWDLKRTNKRMSHMETLFDFGAIK